MSARRQFGRIAWVLAIALTVPLGRAASPPPAMANHQFVDVPSDAFYHAAVDFLVTHGITFGCAPGLYCPDDPTSRAQTAEFLLRLYDHVIVTTVGQVGPQGPPGAPGPQGPPGPQGSRAHPDRRGSKARRGNRVTQGLRASRAPRAHRVSRATRDLRASKASRARRDRRRRAQ